MKTLKEALELLPSEEQKAIVEGILGELENIPKENLEKLNNLNESEKEKFKKSFIKKLLSLGIDDKNLEKLKKVYYKAD